MPTPIEAFTRSAARGMASTCVSLGSIRIQLR
jgi:hypothetical protein